MTRGGVALAVLLGGGLALVVPATAPGAITTAAFPGPAFRPAETTPVQASQAELQLDLDADPGQYRLDVFRSTTTNLAATTLATHQGPLGTPRRQRVVVPLLEGANRFYVRVIDRTLISSTATFTSTDSPVVTRDLETRIYRVTLDALRPYGRTTTQSTADVEYTIDGTAARYRVEVRNLVGPVATVTTGPGSGVIPAVPLAVGENPLFLRVQAQDTFSDLTTQDSNIATIVYDNQAPVINNLDIAFPTLPTGDAVVNVQGDTEPYALVTVNNGAGRIYAERANDLGYFSLLGVELPFSPPGPTTTTLLVNAVDYAGRAAATGTLLADRVDADPRFNYVQMTPVDGTWILPDQPIHVQGSVGDVAGPYRVRFFARAGAGLPLIEEQIADLDPGTAFEKDIAVTADPTQPGVDVIYSVEAEVDSALGVSGRHFMGEVILDVADPEPPLFSDARLDTVLYTNQPRLTVEGQAERWSSIFFSNWHGVVFRPGNQVLTQATNAAAGAEFRNTIDLAALPEQRFSLDVTTVATSTRTGPGSRREIIVERDVTPPHVTQLAVDGESEGTGRLHFHKRADLVTFRLDMSEYMAEAPEVYVTERGSEALPAPLTAVIEPGRVFEYTYAIQSSDEFNGFADVVATGGIDRAGNVQAPAHRAAQVLVVDTLAPVISSLGTNPADGSVLSSAPAPLVVVLTEHPASVAPASGVDVGRCDITVFGPFEVDPARVQSGVLTRFAPGTLEYQFNPGQFVDEGTYQVVVTAVDRAGNTTQESLVYRLDSTPISELFIQSVMPGEGMAFSAATMPRNAQGRQFVSATFGGGTTAELDLAGSVLRVDNLCPIPFQVQGVKSTQGTTTLLFTFNQNLPADGTKDGVYTIRVAPRDRAGNLTPERAYNFIYDTVKPFVLDGWNSLPEQGVAPDESFFPAKKSIHYGPLKQISATVVDGVAPKPNEFTGSGVNTSLTTGAGIELVLVERHPGTSVPVGTSTTNTISSALRFVSVVPPVYSPCFPGVRRANVMRELFNDPVSGEPQGLPVDGTYDGEWELQVTPRDAAGNLGTTASARFTYDTVPPGVTLNLVRNEETAAGPTLTTSGTAWDNDKTPHDQGQGVARVLLRLEALDAGGGTTAPALFDWTPALLPQNVDLVQAETRLPWRLSQRLPSYSGRARLLVRALDKAGNETLLVRELTVQSTVLSATTLVSPRYDAAVPGAVTTFVWNRLEGASRYQLTLLDPSGNPVVRVVDFSQDRVAVNLADQPEGSWTWTVRALDTAGVPGRPAMAYRFRLDHTLPTVLRLFPFDSTQPGSGGGTVLCGQVRIGVTFGETMDVTTAPTVLFQPADPTVPATAVVQLSYLSNEWRGVVDVPAAPDTPDYNGLGTVIVRNARDRAGNVLAEYREHFEVDLGPWFEVRAFANPVVKREVLFHLRSHAHRGGPLENLSGVPYLEVQQDGATRQVVPMTAFQPCIYRGVFVVDQTKAGGATLLVVGTDGRGNTSRRRLRFSVADILAAARFHQAFGSFLTVSLPQGAVAADQRLTVLPGAMSSVLDQAPAPTAELLFVAPLSVVPEGALALVKPGVARCSLAALRAAGTVVPAAHLGLFVERQGRWVYQPSVRSGDELVAQVDAVGSFVLAQDLTPPRVTCDQAAASAAILLSVRDDGAGVNPERIMVTLDSLPVESTFDPPTSTLTVRPSAPLTPGAHQLSVTAADRLGNEVAFGVALQAPAPPRVEALLPTPNPCRGPATFHWRLSDPAARTTLRIFDVAGRLVASRDVGPSPAGPGRDDWDGADRHGRPVAQGVYLARLRVTDAEGRSSVRTTKLAVLR